MGCGIYSILGREETNLFLELTEVVNPYTTRMVAMYEAYLIIYTLRFKCIYVLGFSSINKTSSAMSVPSCPLVDMLVLICISGSSTWDEVIKILVKFL